MNFKLFSTVFLVFLVIPLFTPTLSAQEVSLVILSNVELVTVDEYSAAITWTTNLPSNTEVQWGTTDQLGEENVVDESTLYHMGRIEGLSQGTTYFYRVGSGDRWTEISTFTTLKDPGGGHKLKFALVADTHYDVNGQNAPNGMMYGDSIRLIQSLVTELNEDDSLDLVITLGDLTNSGAEPDYSGFVTEMDKLEVPWHPVLGNHDKTFEGWSDVYNDTIGLPSTYYSTDEGEYRLIMLDSAVQGQVQGGLDDEQLDWLEAELDAHPDTPTLIFMHHMADRTDINGIDVASKNRLDSILAKRPNAFSLSAGHTHHNYAGFGTDEGGQSYITTAAVVSYPIGYSTVRLYGNGYTQAFHKIESELAASEESRLLMITGTGNTGSDDIALGTLDDRSFVLQVPEPQEPPVTHNQPPVLNSISSFPDSILIGETSTITVIATDPDGDVLTYEYKATGGAIEGQGSVVTYHTPQLSGIYTVSVKVTDGEFYTDEKSTEIEVFESDINSAPMINRVLRSVTTVVPGEVVNIEVMAIDYDNDQLTYHYEPSGGSISGSGNNVEWHAPDTTGDYKITIWVSDGELSSEKSSIKITVAEPAKTTSGSGEDSPGFEALIALIAIAVLAVGFRINLTKFKK
ncbi:MAG: metallophosphoesterase [Thermoplasmata archaeon]|nr:MAG: metallophosphoesterase [Thermoplasmata archaeon]